MRRIPRTFCDRIHRSQLEGEVYHCQMAVLALWRSGDSASRRAAQRDLAEARENLRRFR